MNVEIYIKYIQETTTFASIFSFFRNSLWNIILVITASAVQWSALSVLIIEAILDYQRPDISISVLCMLLLNVYPHVRRRGSMAMYGICGMIAHGDHRVSVNNRLISRLFTDF